MQSNPCSRIFWAWQRPGGVWSKLKLRKFNDEKSIVARTGSCRRTSARSSDGRDGCSGARGAVGRLLQWQRHVTPQFSASLCIARQPGQADFVPQQFRGAVTFNAQQPCSFFSLPVRRQHWPDCKGELPVKRAATRIRLISRRPITKHLRKKSRSVRQVPLSPDSEFGQCEVSLLTERSLRIACYRWKLRTPERADWRRTNRAPPEKRHSRCEDHQACDDSNAAILFNTPESRQTAGG